MRDISGNPAATNQNKSDDGLFDNQSDDYSLDENAIKE
jgi:hypothetical protein